MSKMIKGVCQIGITATPAGFYDLAKCEVVEEHKGKHLLMLNDGMYGLGSINVPMQSGEEYAEFFCKNLLYRDINEAKTSFGF